jgi:hypothetical protein
MARRAGSYDAAEPCWRGTIRDGSYPEYVCIHTDHRSQPEATPDLRRRIRSTRYRPGMGMPGVRPTVVACVRHVLAS